MELTNFDLSAPKPWRLDDKSSDAHPYVAILSAGRVEPIAYRYAPMLHNVADFQHIVDCVNADWERRKVSA